MDFLFWFLVLGIVMAGLILAFAFGRAWALLIPVPAALAALAWRAWEFSDLAVLYVIAIAVLGYIGLALGVALRRAARKR